MIFSLLHKLADFISKDTGGKNESPKLIMVVRILVLSMLFYIAINSIIYTSILNNITIMLLLISFLMFLAIFIMSYRESTTKVLFILNLGMAAWIVVNVVYFGWDIGVQHFMILLLVLSFFSSYSQYGFKIFYAIVLTCFRIYLYFLSHTTSPIVTLDASLNHIFQIVNTIIIFWCISVVVYVFSKDSQSLESKLVEYNNQLITQANTDALTGLYNRRRATDYMVEILKPTNTTYSSICICDIDFFKKVNDTYGHDIGDVVLQNISETMKTAFSDKCFIARWGGEEFLIIFPSNNGDEAYLLLEQFRNKVKALNFDTAKGTFHVTMTFGLAEYDFGTDIDSIIKQADEKLYIGKGSGRDRIVY